MAGNLTGNGNGGPGYLDWLAGKGFNQAQFDTSGFVVDLSDSGIDNGTIVPGHFGLYEFGDPSQASRVVYVRLVGTPNPASKKSGCDGHGALNAHIIGGYDSFVWLSIRGQQRLPLWPGASARLPGWARPSSSIPPISPTPISRL